MNKVTEEELKTIKDQQKKTNDILLELGFLSTREHALLHEIADINKQVEKTKLELEQKYGEVNVHIETGEITEIETPMETVETDG